MRNRTELAPTIVAEEYRTDNGIRFVNATVSLILESETEYSKILGKRKIAFELLGKNDLERMKSLYWKYRNGLCDSFFTKMSNADLKTFFDNSDLIFNEIVNALMDKGFTRFGEVYESQRVSKESLITKGAPLPGERKLSGTAHLKFLEDSFQLLFLLKYGEVRGGYGRLDGIFEKKRGLEFVGVISDFISESEYVRIPDNLERVLFALD